MKRTALSVWRPLSPLLLFVAAAFVPPAPAQDVREIRIKAAVSPSFREQALWQRDIQERLALANRIFEPNFGIHFSVKEFILWDPNDGTRETDLLMEELKSFIPIEKNEIVVGFHRMKYAFTKNVVLDLDRIGSAQFFRGFVMIRDPYAELSRQQKETVIAHEFVHLFGGVHVAETGALMAPRVTPETVLSLDPENSEILRHTKNVDFRKGVDSLSDQAVDVLIRVYEKLVRKYPHSDFYYQLGLFYERRGLKARAISTWEEAVRYQYDNPHIHRALGFYYYRSGRYDQAIQELGSAAAHYELPSQKKMKAETYNILGAAYFEKGNYDQAIFNWLNGLTANPDDPLLQGNLAAAYLKSGNLLRGITELEKMLAKYPDDTTTLSNLAVAVIKNGETERGIELLNRALQAERHHRATGQKEGETLGRNALLGDIPESLLWTNLGTAHLKKGQFEKAIQELENSKSLDDRNYEVHYYLALAYLNAKNYEKVIESAKRALSFKQDDPDLFTVFGQAYAETGRTAEALAAARRGLQYADRDQAVSLHRSMAMLLAREERYSEAEQELKTALQVNWQDPETHVALGKVYGMMGRFDEAKRSFKNALRIDPANQEARRLSESLSGD